jgi:hypothetical protein
MIRLPTLVCVPLLSVTVGAGCGQHDIAHDGTPSQESEKSYFGRREEGKVIGGSDIGRENGSIDGSGPQVPAGQIGAPVKKQLDAERKIIFTADIRLKVADFVKADQELQQLLRANQAYVAHSDLSGNAGGNRQGTWTLRVPVANFDAFREAVKNIGELVGYSSDAREITEEYYDLQTRVKNSLRENRRSARCTA